MGMWDGREWARRDGCREKVIQGGFVSTLTKNKNSAADPN